MDRPEGWKGALVVGSQGTLGVGPGILQALVEQMVLSSHMAQVGKVALEAAGEGTAVRITPQAVEASPQVALVVLQVAEMRVGR